MIVHTKSLLKKWFLHAVSLIITIFQIYCTVNDLKVSNAVRFSCYLESRAMDEVTYEAGRLVTTNASTLNPLHIQEVSFSRVDEYSYIEDSIEDNEPDGNLIDTDDQEIDKPITINPWLTYIRYGCVFSIFVLIIETIESIRLYTISDDTPAQILFFTSVGGIFLVVCFLRLHDKRTYDKLKILFIFEVGLSIMALISAIVANTTIGHVKGCMYHDTLHDNYYGYNHYYNATLQCSTSYNASLSHCNCVYDNGNTLLGCLNIHHHSNFLCHRIFEWGSFLTYELVVYSCINCIIACILCFIFINKIKPKDFPTNAIDQQPVSNIQQLIDDKIYYRDSEGNYIPLGITANELALIVCRPRQSVWIFAIGFLPLWLAYHMERADAHRSCRRSLARLSLYVDDRPLYYYDNDNAYKSVELTIAALRAHLNADGQVG